MNPIIIVDERYFREGSLEELKDRGYIVLRANLPYDSDVDLAALVHIEQPDVISGAPADDN